MNSYPASIDRKGELLLHGKKRSCYSKMKKIRKQKLNDEGQSQASDISSGSGASTSHAHTSDDESFESSSEESEEVSIYEVQPQR